MLISELSIEYPSGWCRWVGQYDLDIVSFETAPMLNGIEYFAAHWFQIASDQVACKI